MRRAAPILVTAALFGLAMWLLWGHLVWGILVDGLPGQGTVKNYFISDQLTYLSIAQNVAAGHGIDVEPFTLTGDSVYPSAYYAVFGLVADATGMTTLGASTVVGICASAAFLLAGGALGRWLARSPWGWAAGAAPVLVGTLLWYTDGTWRVQSGLHAQLWQPGGVLYTPNAETPGLALGFLALLALLRGLAAEGRARWLWAGAAGALTGVILNVHTYPFLLTVVLLAGVLLCDRLLAAPSRRGWVVTGAAAAVVTVGLLLPLPVGLVRLALVLAGLAAPILLVPAWRRTGAAPLLSAAAGALLGAAPQLWRMATDVLGDDSFIAYRQDNAAQGALTLPLGDVLLQTLPLLVATGVAVALWWPRRRDDVRARLALAAILAALGAGILLLANASWGFKQEPYRFFPYVMGLLAVLAVAAALHGGRDRLPLRIALLAVLAITLPTTAAFYDQTGDDQFLVVSLQEREGYQGVAAAAASNGGLAYVDRCLQTRTLTALTDLRTPDISPGTALPADPPRTGILQLSGWPPEPPAVPDTPLLQGAGVGSYVTSSICAPAILTEAVRRFGRPQRVPLADPLAINTPPGTAYLVFRVPR